MEHQMAVGLNKGHRVEKLAKKKRHVSKKGALTTRVSIVRDVVKEVVGLAPYEKRGIEMLRTGKDKRCLKFLKKRIGSLRRAKRKREHLNKILLSMKRTTK